MTNFPVESRAALDSALAVAKGGDTINLAPGNYGSLTLTKDFTDYVSIVSTVRHGARFDALTITGGSFIKAVGLKVYGPIQTGIVNSKTHRLFIDGGNHIWIEDCDVQWGVNGITCFGTTNLKLIGNFVDNVGSDYFKLSGVDTVLVENNTLGGHMFPNSTAHEDGMQFQGPASKNLTIRGNLLLPQNGFDIQGIFVAGDKGNIHQNVLIEQNIIHTSMLNGILVADDSTGIIVRNNTLIAAAAGRATIRGAGIKTGNVSVLVTTPITSLEQLRGMGGATVRIAELLAPAPVVITLGQMNQALLDEWALSDHQAQQALAARVMAAIAGL